MISNLWNFIFRRLTVHVPCKSCTFVFILCQMWHQTCTGNVETSYVLSSHIPNYVLLRPRFGFCWPLCAFMNYNYLLTNISHIQYDQFQHVHRLPSWCLLLTTTTKTTSFTALCPGLPRWAGTRRNTHPPTILIIIQSLSASSIYHDP